ncbi:MAG: EAL domain-containing protein [Proteobacteria bacterium]|nr:EAL domain-containing protein [Pseudomonadota bacterium]
MNSIYKKIKTIVGNSTAQSIISPDQYSGNPTTMNGLINGLRHIIFQINEVGQWIYLNAEWEKLTGFSITETLGTDVMHHIHPDDKKQCADFIQDIVKNNPQSSSIKIRFLTRDARLFWVNMRANNFTNPLDNKIHLVGVISDISERIREDGLQQANYRTLYTLINNLCGLVYRGRNDRDWTMEFVSDGCFELTGYRASELINQTVTFGSLINPNDQDLVWINVQSALKENRPYELNYRIRTSDASEKWIWERGKGNFSSNGELLSIEGFIVDITDYKRGKLKENEEILYKTKTKLPQKYLFLDRLSLAIARSKTIDNYSFSLLIIYIDRFKNLQDRFSADIIDKIIIDVGERINGIINPVDSLCLFGDGEFGLLLEHTESINTVRAVTKNIHDALFAPVKINNTETYLTVSIGIYLNSDLVNDRKSVVKDAYTALIRAKSLGGSRYEIVDNATNARIYALDRMEKEIRYALKNNELLLRYQPVVSLEDNVVTAYECSLFWNHPRRGKISSAIFSPVNKDDEIVGLLNKWIMTSIINQTTSWESRSDFEQCLNINIEFFGEKSFTDDFLNQIEQQFLNTTFHKFKFSINIPANAIHLLTKKSVDSINRISKWNIGFNITTDKSTLPSSEDLLALTFDAIKLKNPFLIEDSKESQITQEIARAQIDYVHALEKKVIISGINTKEQLGLMKELNCDYIQGEIVSPPLDKDDVIKYITQTQVGTRLPNEYKSVFQ